MGEKTIRYPYIKPESGRKADTISLALAVMVLKMILVVCFKLLFNDLNLGDKHLWCLQCFDCEF